MIAIAAVMLMWPTLFTDTMRRFSGATFLHVFAVVVRLGLGIVLILYANQSRFPLALQIIGGITIAAGVILAVISRARFKRLMTWALDRFANYARAAAVVTLLFGGFLIYAVL